MISMNSKMKNPYEAVFHFIEDNSLNEFSNSGFSTIEGCFFLKRCFEISTNASSEDFPDKTGYECFINSLNIDDYVSENYLEYGLSFVNNTFGLWNSLKLNDELISVLSMDEFGLKVKFHVARIGERWLSDDLEAYEEAILMISSSEYPIQLPKSGMSDN